MFLYQFVAYFGAASQTMFVMLAHSVLIMHLLGVQDDLQQASEVEVRHTEDYSCSLTRNCFSRTPNDGARYGMYHLYRVCSEKTQHFSSEVGH